MAISKINIDGTEHELETTIANVTGLQEALDAKEDTLTGTALASLKGKNLTANRALMTTARGVIVASDITRTELSYLEGVTSNIQTQLDARALSGDIADVYTTLDEVYITVNGKADSSHTHSISDVSDLQSSLDALYGGKIGKSGTGTGTNSEIFNDYTYNEATGHYSHAEGYNTMASGSYSHAEGRNTCAIGSYSHAEGYGAVASGVYSHAAGVETTANDYQYVVGKYNKNTTAPTSLSDTTAAAGIFIVGVGTGVATRSRSNGFRINPAGKPYALSTMSSSGADYAEYFEWMDSNPSGEDRRGRFVTLDGNKIRYATSDDDYILGVVSSEPTVVGDIHSETWRDMYLRDVFGSRIQETVEVEESVDENGITIPAHIEKRWVLNPDYNPEEKYISREDRPEWDAIGIVGKLVVVDDGTCQVNGYCYPDIDGVATMSENKTAYRVIERLDDTHVRIFIK